MKPIIATTFSGLFLSSEPWKNAHVQWFENAAKELNDDSVKEWAGRKNYFQGVDEVMERRFPDLSNGERTAKARELFFDAICNYISSKPNLLNEDIINYFFSLKEKYRLALITTNPKEAIEKILKHTKLANLFDIIEVSLITEKDDKTKVFDRFIEKNGLPELYIGSSEDALNYCMEKEINCIYINLEQSVSLPAFDEAKNLLELKELIERTFPNLDTKASLASIVWKNPFITFC
jgi:phosphoglycolate phosphatase-like HAD superfamily hydrolase